MPFGLFTLILLLALGSPALAQGTGQTSQPVKRPQTTTGAGVRTGPVATQPSNRPFENPIGQGVPPAVSTTNPTLNSNRTNR